MHNNTYTCSSVFLYVYMNVCFQEQNINRTEMEGEFFMPIM